MNTENYINSGIIEMFVMGALTAEEEQEVVMLATQYPEIKTEIERISDTLETYALSTPKTPDPDIKPMLMASFDYMQRMENGEIPVTPPALNANSKKKDFSQWLDREDMQAPLEYGHTYIKLISYSPAFSTAIVWLKEGAPEEIHSNEYESFLILEGTCDIVIDSEVHQLYPGDQLTIPLHSSHFVKVTSPIPCKLILERKAA